VHGINLIPTTGRDKSWSGESRVQVQLDFGNPTIDCPDDLGKALPVGRDRLVVTLE
jgi:hypothetical protein